MLKALGRSILLWVAILGLLCSISGMVYGIYEICRIPTYDEVKSWHSVVSDGNVYYVRYKQPGIVARYVTKECNLTYAFNDASELKSLKEAQELLEKHLRYMGNGRYFADNLKEVK